jgi:hypothetical protein
MTGIQRRHNAPRTRQLLRAASGPALPYRAALCRTVAGQIDLVPARFFVTTPQAGTRRMVALHARAQGSASLFASASIAALSPDEAFTAYSNAAIASLAQLGVAGDRGIAAITAAVCDAAVDAGSLAGLEGVFLSGVLGTMHTSFTATLDLAAQTLAELGLPQVRDGGADVAVVLDPVTGQFGFPNVRALAAAFGGYADDLFALGQGGQTAGAFGSLAGGASTALFSGLQTLLGQIGVDANLTGSGPDASKFDLSGGLSQLTGAAADYAEAGKKVGGLAGTFIGMYEGGTAGAITGFTAGAGLTVATEGAAAPIIPATTLAGAATGTLVGGAAGGSIGERIGEGLGYAVGWVKEQVTSSGTSPSGSGSGPAPGTPSGTPGEKPADGGKTGDDGKTGDGGKTGETGKNDGGKTGETGKDDGGKTGDGKSGSGSGGEDQRKCLKGDDSGLGMPRDDGGSDNPDGFGWGRGYLPEGPGIDALLAHLGGSSYALVSMPSYDDSGELVSPGLIGGLISAAVATGPSGELISPTAGDRGTGRAVPVVPVSTGTPRRLILPTARGEIGKPGAGQEYAFESGIDAGSVSLRTVQA